jgi:hypothetical protein
MRIAAVVKALSIVLTAGFFTACDKSPTGPAPAPRAEPTIVSVKPSMGDRSSFKWVRPLDTP